MSESPDGGSTFRIWRRAAAAEEEEEEEEEAFILQRRVRDENSPVGTTWLGFAFGGGEMADGEGGMGGPRKGFSVPGLLNRQRRVYDVRAFPVGPCGGACTSTIPETASKSISMATPCRSHQTAASVHPS